MPGMATVWPSAESADDLTTPSYGNTMLADSALGHGGRAFNRPSGEHDDADSPPGSLRITGAASGPQRVFNGNEPAHRLPLE